jgi:hypothetical protein
LTATSHGDAGSFTFSLCSIVSTCDAVTQTGCPAAFACYPTIPTECDCAGAVADGQPCQLAAGQRRSVSRPAKPTPIAPLECAGTQPRTATVCRYEIAERPPRRADAS